MSIAICVRCGGLKNSPFRACQQCHFDPGNNRLAKAKSFMLSDSYYDPETDHRPTQQELEAASRRIKSGIEIQWDEQVLTKLIQEQEVVDREGHPSWFRIVLLLVAILSVPLLALLIFVLRRFM